MAYPPIFDAVRACDVEALRREIAAGGDPDMLHGGGGGLTPLYYAACSDSGPPGKQIRERLECISVLLEAGASVDKLVCGATPLYLLVSTTPPEDRADEIAALVEALVKAGADVNWAHPPSRISVLTMAAQSSTAGAVRMLISAGAVDLTTALEFAIDNDKQRNCAPLLRAGAAIPARYTAPGPGYEPPGYSETCDYMRKIRTAGGYKAYEKAHRQRLTAIFLPKFPALPVEMLGRILEFTWDIGGH